MLPGDRWDKGNRVAGRSRFICGIEKKKKKKKEEKREEKKRKAIPRETRRERERERERAARQEEELLNDSVEIQCGPPSWYVERRVVAFHVISIGRRTPNYSKKRWKLTGNDERWTEFAE